LWDINEKDNICYIAYFWYQCVGPIQPIRPAEMDALGRCVYDVLAVWMLFVGVGVGVSVGGWE